MDLGKVLPMNARDIDWPTTDRSGSYPTLERALSRPAGFGVITSHYDDIHIQGRFGENSKHNLSVSRYNYA